MRSRNINLKKKIAFIASVAMITASTAAYLPMSASATASAVVSNVGVEKLDGTNATAETNVNPTAKTIQTFNIFVKIGGKYLAQNDLTAPDEYKLYNSVSAAKADDFYLTTLNTTQWTQTTTTDDPFAHSAVTNGTAHTFGDTDANYNSLTVADSDELELPYIADANSEVTLEFVAKKGSSLSSRSVDSINVTLDNNGVGKVPTQKTYVVGYSNDSNYNEKEDNFVNEDGDGVTAAGSYEVLDLSGLQIRMGNTNATVADEAYADPTVNGTGETIGNNVIDTAKAYPTEEEDITPLSYEVVKKSGKFAKVLTATLKQSVAPGSTVKVNTGYYPTWSKSSNVTSSGQVSLTMGNDGYAVSDLVTFTKNGKSECYVYVIKNADNTEEKLEFAATISGVAGRTDAPLGTDDDHLNAKGRYKVTKELVAENFADDTIDDSTKIAAVNAIFNRYSNDVADNAFVLDGDGKAVLYSTENAAKYAVYGVEPAEYEATSSDVSNTVYANYGLAAGSKYLRWENNAVQQVKTEIENQEIATLKANNKKFVTEYTIYNNETSDSNEYSNITTDEKHYITVKLKNQALGIIDGTKNEAGATVLGLSGQTVDTWAVGHNDTGLNLNDNKTVRIMKTAPGTAESDIIKTSDGKYIKFKFTTDYKINFYNNSDEDYADTGVDYDGKVEVSGRTITKPETPENKGYSFDGWDVRYTEDGTTYNPGSQQAYSASAGDTQVNSEKNQITPNTRLVAKWRGLRYNVVFNAGEGVITNSGTASDATFGTYFGETRTKTTEYMNLESAAGTDFTAKIAPVLAAREGYKFKGWTNVEGGDTALTSKTYQDAFPGENKTLTLYPVFEAATITASTQVFAFNGDHAQYATDGKKNATNVATAYTGATDANVDNANVEVTFGEKLGTLPTPKLKGYTFGGWYVARFTSTDVSTVRVDENTVLDESIVDTAAYTNFSGNDGKIAKDDIDEDASLTLYAKFTQNENSITYDLGDGEWTDADYDEDNSYKAVTFKVDNDGNVTYYNGNGTKIDADDLFNVDPRVGAGTFTEFTGWTINGGTRKYNSSALANAIKGLDEVGDITLTATYKQNENATTASIVLNANADDAKFYSYTTEDSSKKPSSNYSNYGKTLSKDTTPGTKVAAVWEVKNEQIGDATNSTGWVVARPGYTFKGWFVDPECTTAYSFDAFPAKGVETVVYAGWEPRTSTIYTLNFNLINKDSSYVAKSDSMNYASSDDSDFTFKATYGGTTGSTIKASEKSFEVDGKKYNFSAKDSGGLDTEAELKAEYRKGYKKGAKIYDNATAAAGAAGTQGVDWVLYEDVDAKDIPTNYQSGTSTTLNNKSGLNTGAFVIDSDKYTTIEGNYVEDYQETELGTATNVKINDNKVTWTAAANADHYRIQKTVGDKVYYGAKVTGTEATYKVPTEAHKIAVVAYNADESVKTVSTPVSVAAASLGKATNVKVAADGTVTFTAAEGAVKYQVAKVVGEKTYYSAKSTTTSIKITPASTDYSVYVIAFDADGKSTHSDTYDVSVASDLEAVDDSTITVDGDGKVTWGAAKGAVSYKVFKITKNSEGKEVTNWGSRVTTTSYTFKHLPTTDFKVYVAAIDANGKVKYSAKKKISTLPSVTNVQLSADKKSVTWTAPTGTNADKIVKYQVAKFDPEANKTAYSLKVDAPATSITMKNAAVAGTKIFVLAFDADGNSSYSASIDVK